LRLSPDGGEAERWFTPTHRGQVQVFTPLAVDADEDDNVVFALQRTLATGVEFWVYKLDSEGAEVWQRERDDYASAGDSWRLVDLTIDDAQGVVLVGQYRNLDPQRRLAWSEVWLRRLEPG